MTPPAREAAAAEHEEGTGSRQAGTQHSRPPALFEAAAAIAQLRQSVQVWMDGDRVLPADGSLLLTTLDRVQAGLAGEDAPGVGAGIAAFVGQVQALVQAGVLAAEDGHSPLAAAAAMGCSSNERSQDSARNRGGIETGVRGSTRPRRDREKMKDCPLEGEQEKIRTPAGRAMPAPSSPMAVSRPRSGEASPRSRRAGQRVGKYRGRR